MPALRVVRPRPRLSRAGGRASSVHNEGPLEEAGRLHLVAGLLLPLLLQPHCALMSTDEPCQLPPEAEMEHWTVSLVVQTVAQVEDADQKEVVVALPC